MGVKKVPIDAADNLADFRLSVEDFIAKNWTHEGLASATSGEVAFYRSKICRSWYDALLKSGLSVPYWPLQEGGCAWSLEQKYTWECALAKNQVLAMDFFGSKVLGPILCKWGEGQQKNRFLPLIREARVKWCQGVFEEDTDSDLPNIQTQVLEVATGYMAINGTKMRVADAHIADWIFCLVNVEMLLPNSSSCLGLVLIDMQSKGVELKSGATFMGTHRLSTVTFTNVMVASSNLLLGPIDARTWVAELFLGEAYVLAEIAKAMSRFSKLQETASTGYHNSSPMLDNSQFRRRLISVEIDLRALEATTLRKLKQQQLGAINADIFMLKFRSAQICQQIATLLVSVHGIYALASPDPKLLSNEGPVGSASVLSDMEEYWNTIGGVASDVSVDAQKNIIARNILGL